MKCLFPIDAYRISLNNVLGHQVTQQFQKSKNLNNFPFLNKKGDKGGHYSREDIIQGNKVCGQMPNLIKKSWTISNPDHPPSVQILAKKWMYVRQPNLFKSRSSHIVSMKFHRVHTYIFLDPFLFACDSLYNPKTQLFRSC